MEQARRSNLRRALALVGILTASALLAPDGLASQRAGTRALSPATIEARQRFFGLDNVDPDTGAVRSDRVIVSWFGMTSFAASMNGHVVLLDAWVTRLATSMRYVGTTPEEVAALKPEALFIGHGHHDHVGDLPTIVRANPGIAVVGTGEHCADVKAAISDVSFRCVAIVPAPSSQGQTGRADRLIPGVRITAVRHPHNGEVRAVYTDDPVENLPVGLVPAGCLGPVQYPVDPRDPESWETPNSGQISLLYEFEIGNFALVHSDSGGPIDTGGVADAYARLPRPDVMLSTMVFARKDVRDAVEVLGPKELIPIHHDSPCAAGTKPLIEAEVARIPEDRRPMLRFISDPGNYLMPMSWDPAAPVWRR